ncbi:hypothetical protein GCM10028895_55530 [Pontibacter rugosus]
MNCGYDMSPSLLGDDDTCRLTVAAAVHRRGRASTTGSRADEDRVNDDHVGPIDGGEHVGPATLAPLRGDILETVDAHGTVEGLACQFQPRDEMAFGFPADSVAR